MSVNTTSFSAEFTHTICEYWERCRKPSYTQQLRCTWHQQSGNGDRSWSTECKTLGHTKILKTQEVLNMCICIYTHVYIYIHLSPYIFIHLYIYISLHIFIHLHISLYKSLSQLEGKYFTAQSTGKQNGTDFPKGKKIKYFHAERKRRGKYVQHHSSQAFCFPCC